MMNQQEQEPSTLEHVGINAKYKYVQLRRLYTSSSRQRPIVSVLHNRERSGSGCIDVDKQGPPAPALKPKLERFEAVAAGVATPTPQFELSPPMKSDADFEANTKQDDLSGSGGIFGWLTNDVDQDPDVTGTFSISKSASFASLVSGGSSDNFTNEEEAKQPSLLPSVSLEVEDSSTVINRRQLLKRNDPVFEEDILDPATLSPSAFIFDEPTKPKKATCSFLDLEGDQMGFSSILDPLGCFTPESVTLAVKESTTNLVTPERWKQEDGEIMAIDMLDVADAASLDLKDDPFPSTAAYILDSNSSSSSENKMIMPHQSSEKRETNKSVCAWRNKFDELRAYTRVNGHCNVPQRFPANPSLGRWVSRQRSFMRQCLDAQAQGEANAARPSSGMDVDERMELLTNIGLQASPSKKGTNSFVSGVFISCRNTQEWDNRFAELLRYKSIHGNCDVPVKSDGVYKSLGRWVTSQRKKYKDFHSGKLSRDHAEHFLTRFRRLDEIGFKFKIGSGSGHGSGRPSKKVSGKRKPSRVWVWLP